MFETLPNNESEFYQLLLAQAITALKMNTFLDNFDEERFNFDGVDRSKIFDVNERVFYFDWFYRAHAELFKAYSLFSDERSKNLFLHLVLYRMAGHHSVRIPVDFDERGEEFKHYLQTERGSESKLATSGMFGKLRHFDFEFQNNRYVIDCLGLKYYLFRKQYFYDRGIAAVKPEKGDAVVDGGACLGDSALVFSNAVGPKGKVYAFDPVFEHLEILRYNQNQFPHKNVSIMPFGLSDRDVVCAPIKVNQYSPGFNSAGQEVPLRSIDSLVSSGEITRVDFLKLDVEGFEMNVLTGAMKSIARFKPKLAISLYHKPNDLFEIPSFIGRNFPFYGLRLDHYTIHGEETVLYCA